MSFRRRSGRNFGCLLLFSELIECWVDLWKRRAHFESKAAASANTIKSYEEWQPKLTLFIGAVYLETLFIMGKVWYVQSLFDVCISRVCISKVWEVAALSFRDFVDRQRKSLRIIFIHSFQYQEVRKDVAPPRFLLFINDLPHKIT